MLAVARCEKLPSNLERRWDWIYFPFTFIDPDGTSKLVNSHLQEMCSFLSNDHRGPNIYFQDIQDIKGVKKFGTRENQTRNYLLTWREDEIVQPVKQIKQEKANMQIKFQNSKFTSKLYNIIILFLCARRT